MRSQKKDSHMKSLWALWGMIFLVIFTIRPASAKHKLKVLVFCKTAGYHHASIAVGVVAIQKLGAENDFDVDSTTDGRKFTIDNLKQYAAVIFLSTTHDVLDDAQQKAFIHYIEAGGGFVGIHAATDCEYNWQWYGNLVGAYFESHPAQQEAIINVVDSTNIATKHLPRRWKRFDEWYNFKWIEPNLHILLTIDESSYKSLNVNTPYHPMAWYHEYDGGRAFYTELGHTDESYSDPLYLQHILGGIKYAMGIAKPKCTN
jgi:type 1 glutamine amidotransferase